MESNDKLLEKRFNKVMEQERKSQRKEIEERENEIKELHAR